jgi:hypothetical protein
MSPADDWVRSSGQYALDFDGVDDNVIAQATLSGPLTVSIWGNRRTAGSGSSRVIWGADSTTYIATIKPTAVGTRSDTTAEVNFSGFTFTNNVWFHLVISRDAANGVRIWKDGVQSTSGSQAVSGTYTLNALGRYSTASAFWWDGLIDDVAAYNRALTAGEIRTLSRRRGIAYEARRNQDYGSSGFQAAWARQRTQLIGGGLR